MFSSSGSGCGSVHSPCTALKRTLGTISEAAMTVNGSNETANGRSVEEYPSISADRLRASTDGASCRRFPNTQGNVTATMTGHRAGAQHGEEQSRRPGRGASGWLARERTQPNGDHGERDHPTDRHGRRQRPRVGDVGGRQRPRLRSATEPLQHPRDAVARTRHQGAVLHGDSGRAHRESRPSRAPTPTRAHSDHARHWRSTRRWEWRTAGGPR